ncbi:MAG: hypothetical protein U0237_16680 [Thermoleophilia bacterium]
MRLLLGTDGDGDAAAAFTRGDRAPVDGRPWVLANMVASADGATAVEGEVGNQAPPTAGCSTTCAASPTR